MKYFDNSQQLENLAKSLSQYTTGSKITNMLTNLQVSDSPLSEGDTKWKRLHNSFCNSIKQTNSEEIVIKIIEWIMSPQNFIETPSHWTEALNDINSILQFNGLKVDDSGKVFSQSKPKNFDEAKSRYSSLRKKLQDLKIHPQILSLCTTDILNKDYYSIIFESSKITLSKIKELSNLNLDGIALINKAFDGKKPLVVMNTLSTSEEKNKFFGLKVLLMLIVYYYRNPKAHELKSYDQSSEKDCIESLIIISKALYELDHCQPSSAF